MNIVIKIIVYIIALCSGTGLCYFVGKKIGRAIANKSKNKGE